MNVEQINEIKDSISGDNFKTHTKESLIQLNKDLYNDNYLGNLEVKTKVQIKNLLMKRLDEDLLDIEIAEKTGYGEKEINKLVDEMMFIIQGMPGFEVFGTDEYDRTYKLFSDVTRFNIRSEYKNDKTDDKINFLIGMTNIVFNTVMVHVRFRVG